MPTAAPSLAATDGRPATEDLSRAPLALRGLTVSYGGRPAVFSVDMTIEPGSMTAILGPNGAGKSTLIKAALGIVPRLAGSVTSFGLPVARALPRIAYVPQRAAVDWDFPARVIDVVLQGMSRELGLLRPIRARHRARAAECLARVGMEDFANRQIGELSGGQQQRVFLARALAQGADLYLLDEPFAGVDAATEKAIIGVLKSLRAEGNTLVVVHHDLTTVRDYFTHAMLLNVRKVAEGPVATAFTPQTLQDAYGGRLAEAQIDRLDLRAL
jgi:manganese/zinc/iron transport system ATP- binding protein